MARRGRLSAQQLADATTKLGYPITRSQIANYESGRKQSLDITELLVLAAALNVPALSLLFPDRPDHTIDILPDTPATTLDAITRFVGEPLWPHHEVTALIEQLGRIEAGMGGHGGLTGRAVHG